MIPRNSTVLVALSGGADSVALLHALWRLKGRLRCRLRACHIYHGLRGEEAEADAKHAAACARSLGVACAVKRTEVASFAKSAKLSLEDAARRLRYRLLLEQAERAGASRVATGHTADDQAETVLLNLLRGTGVDGLAGIPPVRSDIIRPLLDVTRAEVEAYCLENKLAYRLDSSNLDVAFTRNRIRHQLLPVLREIQPNVVSALCRLAEIARGENEVMGSLAGRLIERLGQEEGGALVMGILTLSALPAGLQRRVLRAAIERVRGDLLDVDMERTEAVLELVRDGRTGAVIELPGGVRVARGYDAVTIAGPAAAVPSRLHSEWVLSVPGALDIPALGVSLTARRSRAARPPDSPNVAALDADTLGSTLEVRTWRAGDRFVPLGMSRSKKLQDFFVDKHVPRRERAHIPLVLSGDQIVWVVGHRISDRHKVTDRTRRTVRLTVAPLD